MNYCTKIKQKTVFLHDEMTSYNFFSYQDKIAREIMDGWILKHALLDSKRTGVLVFEKLIIIENEDEYLNL